MKEQKTFLKAFLDRNKELEYINKMHSMGWKLTSVRFAFYSFEKNTPNKYKTVLYYAERIYQSTFIQTVTECGYEIVHHTNEGKYILYYLNIASDSQVADFLTDSESKRNHIERGLSSIKRDALVSLITAAIAITPGAVTVPSIIKLLKYEPEKFYEIISNDILGAVLFLFFTIFGIVAAVISINLFRMYCRNKARRKELISEMKIYE